MPHSYPYRRSGWRSAIAPALALAGLLGMLFTASASADDAVMLASNPELGSILSDANGMTLYTYDRDERGANASACYDACAVRWPIFTVSETPLGVSGVFSTFTRTDGVMQAALNGWPLYYFQNDANAGETAGNGVGGVWHVVSLAPNMVTVGSTPVGSVLADGAGMTLYTYDRDERGTGTSACYGACAVRWPIFGVSDIPVGVAGDFTTFMRTDGVTQAALNGWPLYYFQSDANPGDTAGDGVGGVWHIVSLSADEMMGNDMMGNDMMGDEMMGTES